MSLGSGGNKTSIFLGSNFEKTGSIFDKDAHCADSIVDQIYLTAILLALLGSQLQHKRLTALKKSFPKSLQNRVRILLRAFFSIFIRKRLFLCFWKNFHSPEVLYWALLFVLDFMKRGMHVPTLC